MKFIPNSEYWQSVYPDGLTEEQFNNELADFEFLIDNISKVYMHVTGGQASKPLIYGEVINSLHDDFCSSVYHGAVKDVIDIVNSKTAFPGVRTTWDYDQMLHIKEEIVKEIKQQLGV